jgi:hypothetical protein
MKNLLLLALALVGTMMVIGCTEPSQQKNPNEENAYRNPSMTPPEGATAGPPPGAEGGPGGAAPGRGTPPPGTN